MNSLLSTRSALLAIVVAFTGAASAPSASAPMSGMQHGSSQMHESMMSGMQKMQAMQPSGDTDKDFAMMMRMHHQNGIEMAKAEIQHGKSAELKAMAKKIIAAQQKEIAQFDQWLASHK